MPSGRGELWLLWGAEPGLARVCAVWGTFIHCCENVSCEHYRVPEPLALPGFGDVQLGEVTCSAL